MLFDNLYQYIKVFQCGMSTFVYYANSLTNKFNDGCTLMWIDLDEYLNEKFETTKKLYYLVVFLVLFRKRQQALLFLKVEVNCMMKY